MITLPDGPRRAGTRFGDASLDVKVGEGAIVLLQLVAAHDQAAPGKIVSDLITARAAAIGIAKLAKPMEGGP